MADWVSILTSGIIGAITGGISALAAPWANWGIEKRRIKMNEGRDRVKRWRAMASSYRGLTTDGHFRYWLEQQQSFATLKPHLSDAYKRDLYDNTSFRASRGGIMDELHER